MIDQLLTIRQQQMKVFEDITMFEQRILYHQVPDSFDNINISVNKEYPVTKRSKVVQELKRQMLNSELENYEIKIQHYEDLYEQGLATLQAEIGKIGSSYQIDRLNDIMYSIKSYEYHHTQMLLRQIRFKESCFHAKLLRYHRRDRLRSARKTVNVYPQIIVDVPKVKLSQNQLDYLSRTGQ
jgi:hypothetical protein